MGIIIKYKYKMGWLSGIVGFLGDVVAAPFRVVGAVAEGAVAVVNGVTRLVGGGRETRPTA